MSQPQPARSFERTLASGQVRRFSSKSDFEDFFRVVGEPLGGHEDLRWMDAFHAWVQQGQTGCRYAQHRAKHVEQAQYLTIAIDVPLQPHLVEDLQESLLSAADAQAVFLVMPSIAEPAGLSRVVKELAASPFWEVDVVADNPDEILVGLRWPIPATEYRSEVLGFGPFDSFPVTRRSPVTLLVLRTHPPLQVDPSQRVHLAQMPYFGIELGDKADYFRESTSRMRSELLAGEMEQAAKAKVTARFSRDEWSAT